MSPTTSSPASSNALLRKARAHLRKVDPVLAQQIERNPHFDPLQWTAELPAMDLFGVLLFQITGQQLSVAVTRRTIARIQEFFGGHLPSPAELLDVEPSSLRGAGLSWRKVATLRDLAGRLTDGRLDVEALSQLPDEEFIAQLTTVPGIGPWTAQGALLVGLQRQDVVLPGDLALRKAIRTAYQLDHLPTQQEVLTIAEKWRPYRSLATATCSPRHSTPQQRPEVRSNERESALRDVGKNPRAIACAGPPRNGLPGVRPAPAGSERGGRGRWTGRQVPGRRRQRAARRSPPGQPLTVVVGVRPGRHHLDRLPDLILRRAGDGPRPIPV